MSVDNPMRCFHANEAPHICPCPSDCYCKTRTCRVAPPGPVESRKRLPKAWLAYDQASSRGAVIAGASSVEATLPGTVVKFKTAVVIELLDLLRSLLRERIEADAAAGGGDK